MKDFIPIATPPPEPGWYWTAVVTYGQRDKHGRRNVTYSPRHQYYDGINWVGDEPTHWYGEVQR